jgi:hypothetical protein
VVLAQGADSLGAAVELGNRGTCLPLPTGDDLLSVVVVNKQMPWVGLSWGRMYARGSRGGKDERNKHANTHDLPRFRALVRR